jgi:hypothetical protein
MRELYEVQDGIALTRRRIELNLEEIEVSNKYDKSPREYEADDFFEDSSEPIDEDSLEPIDDSLTLDDRRWALEKNLEDLTTKRDHLIDKIEQFRTQISLPVTQSVKDSHVAPEPLQDEFVAVALIRGRFRLLSLTPDGSYRFLDGRNNLHNIIYVASGQTLALEAAVEELESLINDRKANERAFQDFFERYPEFILNDEYKRAHPHIVLAEDNKESLIPDFLLEPINQDSLCDVLDLKLPSAEIFVLKKNRIRFSSAVFEACAQLREYSLFFDEEKNRNAVYEKHRLLAFKPRLIVIIGRRGDVSSIDLRKMQLDVPQLCVRTYDDLISRMQARIAAIKARWVTEVRGS